MSRGWNEGEPLCAGAGAVYCLSGAEGLVYMVRHPSADAQQPTVIKRQTWGGGPVLSGRRSRGCWNSRCIEFCQGSCNRSFQPPLQLRGEGIYSPGCKQGCFQPGPPDSATMRQARRSSSAMLAKYTAWVTAPGRRAC